MTGAISTLRQMQQARDLFALVAPRLAEVERFLDREMDNGPAMVRESAGYVLASGGKRLRPALVLLVSRMLGVDGDRDVRYGAVVEMIHTATLMHDDIIDGSDLRRGRPTANNRWGNQVVVLVGDWLYSRTMDLCLEVGDVEVMRRLVTATLLMTEGEILADRVRGSIDVTDEQYMEITRRKTAELFAAACSLPALFDGSKGGLEPTLRDFGLDLGVCFQLVDDLLDFTADRRQLGKPVMADLREGRATLPIILLRDRTGDAELHRRLAEVAATGRFDAIGEAEVLELLREHGALETTRERARWYAERAAGHVAALPECREREVLAQAAQLLVDRTT